MTAPDPAEVQQEIDQTGERLGEAVGELAVKADVKARAQDKVTEVTAGVRSTAAAVQDQAAALSGQARQSQVVQCCWPLVVAAAGVVLVGSIVVWRRRRP
jgi:Protein of unknown function (DUF3618)